jgi:hypothetical protein
MVRLLGVSAATVCARGRVDAAQLNLLLPVILVAGTSFVFQTSSGIFIGFIGWVSLVTVLLTILADAHRVNIGLCERMVPVDPIR